MGQTKEKSEILIFAPGQFKTKETCKHAVTTLPFVIMCIPDWYKTREMCDEVIRENCRTLKCVPWLL